MAILPMHRRGRPAICSEMSSPRSCRCGRSARCCPIQRAPCRAGRPWNDAVDIFDLGQHVSPVGQASLSSSGWIRSAATHLRTASEQGCAKSAAKARHQLGKRLFLAAESRNRTGLRRRIWPCSRRKIRDPRIRTSRTRSGLRAACAERRMPSAVAAEWRQFLEGCKFHGVLISSLRFSFSNSGFPRSITAGAQNAQPDLSPRLKSTVWK